MRNRQLLTIFLGIIMCFLALLPGSVAGAENRFEEPVPFGIAESKNGSPIQIYAKPGNKQNPTMLTGSFICSILSESVIQGNTWYQISYFDSAGVEHNGYVMESSFSQLTLSGLIMLANDPDVIYQLQHFAGMAGSVPYVQAAQTSSNLQRSNPALVVAAASTSTPIPASTVAPGKGTTSTESNKTEYVLNKNTKKFHYPWCSSVGSMKAKNRLDFTGTREEVIKKGYKPCGKCNP